MAEQKGRGGKKPKYQIADIGGSDLTSQDLSTERVLNFLIRGEAAAGEGSDAARDDPRTASPSERPPTTRDEEPADSSLPSSETRGKKSLDHLFQRASGEAGAAKSLKLDLHRQEQPAPPKTGVEVAEHAMPVSPVTQAESAPGRTIQPPKPTAVGEFTLEAPPSEGLVQPVNPSQIVDLQAITDEILAAAAESADLIQLIGLWKSFYRLKDGEIDALKVMYLMSHGLGSSECYVKMHKLAEMSNLTYRYCQKVVRSLEQLGWITKLKEYDPATQMGVLYRVNLKPTI